eukprot:s400_g10.t3
MPAFPQKKLQFLLLKNKNAYALGTNASSLHSRKRMPSAVLHGPPDWWENATFPRRHALQDPQSLCESSFTAVKLKRKGRTADGLSCDCTDKPKKKADVAASPLNLFGSKEKKGTEQIAKELERERQQAERENADKEMATAFGEFEGAKEHYDKAISEVNSAWKAFLEQQPKYETSFWLLKAMHDSECRKLMEDHNGVMADCHKNWLTAREEYFALPGFTASLCSGSTTLLSRSTGEEQQA